MQNTTFVSFPSFTSNLKLKTQSQLTQSPFTGTDFFFFFFFLKVRYISEMSTHLSLLLICNDGSLCVTFSFVYKLNQDNYSEKLLDGLIHLVSR